jgi:uncharacterized protein YqfB (UPF0267 family)
MYEVQTWDFDEYCINYHSVEDAIDYEDAHEVISKMYPDQKVISVIRKNDR